MLQRRIKLRAKNKIQIKLYLVSKHKVQDSPQEKRYQPLNLPQIKRII
jgi:hypothetical protein